VVSRRCVLVITRLLRRREQFDISLRKTKVFILITNPQLKSNVNSYSFGSEVWSDSRVTETLPWSVVSKPRGMKTSELFCTLLQVRLHWLSDGRWVEYPSDQAGLLFIYSKRGTIWDTQCFTHNSSSLNCYPKALHHCRMNDFLHLGIEFSCLKKSSGSVCQTHRNVTSDHNFSGIRIVTHGELWFVHFLAIISIATMSFPIPSVVD
jgi:hypothetical protein